jgi:hypothetical protein
MYRKAPVSCFHIPFMIFIPSLETDLTSNTVQYGMVLRNRNDKSSSKVVESFQKQGQCCKRAMELQPWSVDQTALGGSRRQDADESHSQGGRIDDARNHNARALGNWASGMPSPNAFPSFISRNTVEDRGIAPHRWFVPVVPTREIVPTIPRLMILLRRGFSPIDAVVVVVLLAVVGTESARSSSSTETKRNPAPCRLAIENLSSSQPSNANISSFP